LKRYFIFPAVIIIFFSDIISAQEYNSGNKSKHSIGFIIGFSEQPKVNNYEYQIALFQAQYYYSFLQHHILNVQLIVQPQYNLVQPNYDQNTPETNEPLTTHNKNAFEFGVNAGILIRLNLLNNFFSLYTYVSSGPHYVSQPPQRQADGFIFSDNFFAGINIKLYKNYYFDFRSGFRHVSNAGLAHPNGGVNTVVYNWGVYVKL
jgi:hypothetical protein